MRAIEFVKNKIDSIVKKYNEGELRDNLVEELMYEAGYEEEKVRKGKISEKFSSSFFSFLCELFYKKIIEENKNIPPILYLIKKIPLRAYLFQGKLINKDNGEIIAPGIILEKDVFIKILERLKLNKTKKAYTNYLMINYKEINASDYLSSKELNNFKDIKDVYSTLENEFTERFG